MAGQYAGCGRQCAGQLAQAFLQMPGIASVKVAAPDAAHKDGVAGEQKAFFGQIEAHAARGVSGSGYHLCRNPVQNPERTRLERHHLPAVGLIRQTERLADVLRRVKNALVGGIHIHRHLPFLRSRRQAQNVVKVTVREQYALHRQAVLVYIVHQTGVFVPAVGARVYYHALAAAVAKHISAFAQRVKVKKLEHSAKIQILLLTFVSDNKNNRLMHIAIAGNIGSGKTTLTRLLCQQYGWTPRFEPVDHNPYLSDFYEDMERWSFNLQIYFLNKRFRDVVEISRSSEVIVQDRTIYEDANIFAPNLHDMGLMSTRDFENYKDLFSLMISLVKAPDLLIYLRSSIPNVVAKIQKRGREYENSIRIDYLKGLHDRYEKWIEGYKDGKLLILDVDRYDVEENPADLRAVCDLIDAQLNGLF